MVISNKPLRFLVAILVAFLPLFSTANPVADSTKANTEVAHKEEATHGEAQAEPTDVKSEIKEFINHHLLDAHNFTFNANKETGEHYGFSLPIILWDNESGLQVFSSSKFHHGETVAEVDGNFYKLYHGKIYKTDAAGTINYDEHHHPTNAKPLDFSITKNVFSMLFTSVLLLFMFIGLAKSYKKGPIPTGFGRVLEPLILFIRDEIAIPNIGEKKYAKYMPYLLTIFFFVWINNLIGLIPFFPFSSNLTGNIYFTFVKQILPTFDFR